MATLMYGLQPNPNNEKLNVSDIQVVVNSADQTFTAGTATTAIIPLQDIDGMKPIGYIRYDFGTGWDSVHQISYQAGTSGTQYDAYIVGTPKVSGTYTMHLATLYIPS